jgi:hypothetical protein
MEALEVELATGGFTEFQQLELELLVRVIVEVFLPQTPIMVEAVVEGLALLEVPQLEVRLLA